MIHRESGVQLFSYRFREDIKLEPTLISGFISAVISFAEELKPSEGKEIVKFIDRGDFVLQVEPGKLVTGLLILSRKDYSFRDKLKILVTEFERRYYNDIENWNGISATFTDFNDQVKQLISAKQISPYHIPTLINTDRAPKKLDDMKWAIITRINGQNDISSISEELELSVEVVQGIISYFEEVGLVETSFEVNDNTVFELTKKGLKAIEIDSDCYKELLSDIGKNAHVILMEIGNEQTFHQLKNRLNFDYDMIKEMVEQLVSNSYLEILPKWKIHIDQKSLQFTRSLEFIDDLFETIFDEADNWISFREIEDIKKNTVALTLLRDEEIAKVLNDKSHNLLERNTLKSLLTNEQALERVIEKLEAVFQVLQNSLEREIGSNLTRDILTKTYRRLKNDYDDLLNNQKELQTIMHWLR
jgi:predicted transcriptional regulator